jgi:hypothetical protein
VVVAVALTNTAPPKTAAYPRNVIDVSHSEFKDSFPFKFNTYNLQDVNLVNFAFLNNVSLSRFLLSDPDGSTEVLRTDYTLYLSTPVTPRTTTNLYPLVYTDSGIDK